MENAVGNATSQPLQDILEKGKRRLSPYRPPVRDWRFWAVQGLIALIAGTHTVLEIMRYSGYTVFVGSQEAPVILLSFIPVSLFFVPVVYAALNFGLAGAVATALWCTVLTIPNIMLHHETERVREVLQLGIVDAIAVFVGQRVDREMSAREEAEDASAALRVSEAKYRGLFESSPAPILVLDPQGVVREANPAAGVLFARSPGTLKGAHVSALFEPSGAERILGLLQEGGREDAYVVLKSAAGEEMYLEPMGTRINDGEGEAVIQVLLRDVTAERERQLGLKAYAAHVLRGQEEERKRIAQELHDETVQTLILLCRRLDLVEAGSGTLSSTAVDGLREARKTAESVVKDLRDFSKALRPPTLDDLGLVTSIRRLLMDLMDRAKVGGQMRVVGEDRRLPPDVELGVFRIAQEALHNVERHAQASEVTVTLTFSPRESRLDVMDNGVGFVPPHHLSDIAARGRLGLLGMQERAELLGGKLDIRSTPGKGTRLTASIPVPADSAAQALGPGVSAGGRVSP